MPSFDNIHTNRTCLFIFRRWLFSPRFLDNIGWLLKLPYCSCFQFAIIRNHPDYSNKMVTLEELESFMAYSEGWDFYKSTSYSYNLQVPKGNFRDMFVKHALKEYDREYYYRLCDKNKTPDPRHMYFALLNYCYPLHSKPRSKEKYFWSCYNKAKKYVFNNFDTCKPISYKEAMNVLPKSTGAGFVSMKFNEGLRLKKSEVLPDIERQYKINLNNILNKRNVEDYCMFAMRGHLSDRLKKKTRPVWLVSASTIVSELRFYQPFYDQLNTKPFFRNIFITGKGSLPRLHKYLLTEPDATFYNTDISAWDSYRANWLHEDIMVELRKKLILSSADFMEYNYCIDSAIRTKVLFPNGHVWKKKAGIISGTSGTLLFNSILNCIGSLTILNMMKEISLDGQFDFGDRIMLPNWLGDDFSFLTYHKFDLDKFADLSLTYLGVKLKPDKTIIAETLDDRKYLGYQLKGGLLYRDEKEMFQSVLYMEREMSKEFFFSISFSRFFSYLLLGGINNYNFLNFFYFYCGRYKKFMLDSDFHYRPGMDNIFKLLKDVWNINIPAFSLDTLRSMNFELMKYVLLYGYDLNFKDLL